MSSVATRDPEILSGTPVFAGTRVPVKNLTDYLEGGSTIDECVPGKLGRLLIGHEVETVSEVG